MNFLKGYKTYIIAILMIILSGVKAQGYIDDQTYQIILTLLSGLGLAALRAGVKNSVRGTDETTPQV